MNSRDLLFRTARFNLSEVKPHFINPCCFGEDLAAWLNTELVTRGYEAETPGQEDWGWYLPLRRGGDSYYLDISGNADQEGSNHGEWRVMVEKRRSIWDRLTGRNRITVKDSLFGVLENLLRSQPDFCDIRPAND